MEADREQVCSQQFHGCYNEECMQMLLISEKVTSSLAGRGQVLGYRNHTLEVPG